MGDMLYAKDVKEALGDDLTIHFMALYADPRGFNLRNDLAHGLLSADRMTMAASIETRVPFLDHEVAAFVSSLPDDYRVRGLRGKWILREAGKDLLQIVFIGVLALIGAGVQVLQHAHVREDEPVLGHQRDAAGNDRVRW